MKQHFSMFAAYNCWANGELYAATTNLTDEEFSRDAGAAFGSAMGTLNHILAGDRIWLRRFTGEGAAPTQLDAVLHPALVDLRAARVAEDKRIIAWINQLEERDFAGDFTYLTITDNRTVTQKLGPALAHFFNHQTHHRGQVHTILTMLGKPSVALDLIYFQRTEEGRPFA